jgi:regulator of protease activity HflC (stomatin/prohibitin superfamily)
VLPFDSWLEVSPTDPARAVRVSGRADRDRGAWCEHSGCFVVWAARLRSEVVDVDLVDFVDPYPTPEELLIAIDEVRQFERERRAAELRREAARRAKAAAWAARAASEARSRMGFASLDEIDAAIERARAAQKARSE